MTFDFAAVSAPFRMQPGLRRLPAGATQLTPTLPGSRTLREKLDVLSNHAPQALLASDGFDPLPALRQLAAQAAEEHPAAFEWNGGARCSAPLLGWSLDGNHVHGDGPAEIGRCLDALPPSWRWPGLVSLAFAEDFAIVDARSGRVPWLAVCLPSHWVPDQKVGRHFTEIHAPVADNRLIVTAADHLMRLVTSHERWERFVWTITRHPRLDAHPARCPTPPWPARDGAEAIGSAETIAAAAFFRTERQTFIPLPGAGQALFTIHVDVQPLTAAVTSRERAGQLHAALASMSDAVLAYRGLTDAREGLLDWLARRAGVASAT